MNATDRDARRWEAACAALASFRNEDRGEWDIDAVARDCLRQGDALLAAFERSQQATAEPTKCCGGSGIRILARGTTTCPGCVDCQPPTDGDDMRAALFSAALYVPYRSVVNALHKAGLRLEPVQTR